MTNIPQTNRSIKVLTQALEYCKEFRHEFITPEHVLMALAEEPDFAYTLLNYYSPNKIKLEAMWYLKEQERMPEEVAEKNVYLPSAQMQEVLQNALAQISNSGAEAIDITHLAQAILELTDSQACFILKSGLNGRETEFMSDLISNCESSDIFEDPFGDPGKEAWRNFVTCMNDHYQEQNPLIGRESELRQTIQVLCRCDKNNPLHIGEAGVGKTALIWGLAGMIEAGKVPARLKGSRIYQIDVGTLLAGTQYRGDFENRIKQIMDGISAESDNNIVYIDEIHTLVGTGATGESAMDATNMLKSYLESGRIRFIGSTTYEEYNRHFARSKGFVRRFKQIDIPEPTDEESKHILEQLRPRYEAYHGVKYDDSAIAYAVEGSAKHITDRHLPDKAIDLLDEAGAAMEISGEKRVIGKREIAEVLSKTCKVDALSEIEEDDYQKLQSLESRMLSSVYGQDEAIRQVVESVQMSRAGLLDDNKPLASLLFVGPTGVGKTEVARVLARELGIELVRFDMSEYMEKHAVAKLIGTPAGYVGYDDGGLLTDAIRKNPNCVLLLDEIEKAHEQIYDILLQVMDYARLTDNKGRKADFRNVVLIMTSNAGAQYASQASIGFNGKASRGEAMLRQVKKTFKPEFLNRLSGTVVFHDMDMEMARMILGKKLRELESKLSARQVSMKLDDAAFAYLLKEGYTAEYGAREMDRVISQRLKPLLMKEILFGRLQKGGTIKVEVCDGGLVVG